MVDCMNLVAGETRVRVTNGDSYYGSSYKLHGLLGTYLRPHPLVKGWVKIKLDPNTVTPYDEWSIAVDRLETL